MKGLVRFISFALNAVISYLAIAFARAFFVRLPPRNYRTACPTSANERRRPLIEWKKDNLSTPFDVYVDDVPISQTLRPKPLDFVENDFCVYTATCSPTKPKYIAPKYPNTSESINMAMLRAASDHISDILQERRRKVDAGEDPCLKRKEARRRRTEELVLLSSSF